MPIAIHTRYLPATDKRQSRVKAMAWRDTTTVWSVTIPYDWNGNEHEQAARALAAKYRPDLVDTLKFCGPTIDGRGDVYTIGA